MDEDAVGPADRIIVPVKGFGDMESQDAEIDLTTLDIFRLEEMSYDLAAQAGKLEAAMWAVLAHIWESGKWKASHAEWEAYLQDWLFEVCNRAGGQRPYSLREAQQRLSNYRRLGRWAGVDIDTALAGSSDVMASLSRALGDWDHAGNLVNIRPQAVDGLNAIYPNLPLKDQIKEFAEQVASEPVHKKAIELIGDVLGANRKDLTYIFDVMQTVDEGLFVQARVQRWDVENGIVISEEYFRSGEVWPDEAIAALRTLLRPRSALAEKGNTIS